MKRSVITQRINGAKNCIYLPEMHPEDRVDYLAGKYNKKTKIRFRCPVCGEYYMQMTKEREKGRGHESCSHKQRGIDQRYGENYPLFDSLTPEYQEKCKNKEMTSHDCADFVCQTCGKVYSAKLYYIQRQSECSSCARKRGAAKTINREYPFMNEIRPDYQDKIRQGLVTSQVKVPFICPEHGEYWQTLNNHSQYGCAECGKIKAITSKRRKEYDCVAEMREDYQARIANGEINSYDKVPFICEIHGEYWQELNNHNKGQGCPMCNMGQTPYSFLTFLQTLQTEIKPFDRQQIKPLEIDFYLPEYSLGFEFNDIATHQTLFTRQEVSPKNYGGKPYDYHIKKWQMAKEKGITLMHVWDVDWQDDVRREKIKSIIISLLRGEKVAEINKNTMRFYEYKPRAVIERSPKNFIEMRDKCINGEAARFYTCGIMI